MLARNSFSRFRLGLGFDSVDAEFTWIAERDQRRCDGNTSWKITTERKSSHLINVNIKFLKIVTTSFMCGSSLLIILTIYFLN